MTRAVIHFYSSDFCRGGFEECVRDGVIMGAAGTLNLLWEDFSALEVAEELGLSEVSWDAIRDSSPGDLTLTIHYAALRPSQVEQRFQRQDWIEGYEFGSPLTLQRYD